MPQFIAGTIQFKEAEKAGGVCQSLLQATLRRGAQRRLAEAIEQEVQASMPAHGQKRDANGQDHGPQEEYHRIHKEVPFPPVDFLVAVVTPLVAALRAFAALTVDDPRAGRSLQPPHSTLPRAALVPRASASCALSPVIGKDLVGGRPPTKK